MDELDTSTKRKFWPTPQDYNEAVQNLRENVSDPDLQQGVVEVNQLGLPAVRSGAFASAYKVTSGGRSWALRCFLRQVDDIAQRYERIAEFIRKDNLDCTVDFDYQPHGIRVGGQWFPILKMAWVEGETLDRYIANREGRISPRIAESFREMCKDLRTFGIAHGDLQHGNIIVRDERLCLVDYDGMFVPRLDGWKSHELGHPNYQHPTRTANNFNARLDSFSAWHIYLSLQALAVEPKLYGIPSSWDECLLFNRTDFQAPRKSFVFAMLERYDHQGIKQLARFVRWQLGMNIDDIPEFGDHVPTDLQLAPVQFNFAHDTLEEQAVVRPVPVATTRPVANPPAFGRAAANFPNVALPPPPNKQSLQPPSFDTIPAELLQMAPRRTVRSDNVTYQSDSGKMFLSFIVAVVSFFGYLKLATGLGSTDVYLVTGCMFALLLGALTGVIATLIQRTSRGKSCELIKWGQVYPGKIVTRKGPFRTHYGSGQAYLLEFDAYDNRGNIVLSDHQVVDATNTYIPDVNDVVAIVASTRTGERAIYETLDTKAVPATAKALPKP
jgi:hypothetical protein